MKETIIVISLVILLIVSSVFGGFLFGRAVEKRQWKQALPKAMDSLCIECQQVGQEEGFKNGKLQGLKTCDDVLSTLDEGRR